MLAVNLSPRCEARGSGMTENSGAGLAYDYCLICCLHNTD